MSMKTVVRCEIRDLAIMKETVEEMGYGFTAVGEDALQIKASYPITVNATDGTITCDSYDKSTVEKIMVNYQVNLVKEEALREGAHFEQEVLENGDIHISIRN